MMLLEKMSFVVFNQYGTTSSKEIIGGRDFQPMEMRETALDCLTELLLQKETHGFQ